MGFEALGLKEWIVKQISAVGYKIPTPVQVNCIPPILQGTSFCQGRLIRII